MGKSSSVDLRVRIVGEIERGQSCRGAARRFGVSAATGGSAGTAQGADGIAGACPAGSSGGKRLAGRPCRGVGRFSALSAAARNTDFRLDMRRGHC